jgi:hypothetical protein
MVTYQDTLGMANPWKLVKFRPLKAHLEINSVSIIPKTNGKNRFRYLMIGNKKRKILSMDISVLILVDHQCIRLRL